ncbi:Fe-Mn family superoxide dismutase [Candidatus Chlorohelix sp.]|uniref:superoxide dismutase n=1 Tax=Candidatus Chlorohelix sp. TaxID=3139201 RepID=UPI0030499C10
MAILTSQAYAAKDFNLAGLNGISDKTLEIHFALYKGYVTNTNTLNEQIADLINNGKIGTPAYAELKRRLGFEYNGMVLHEYYFGNLKNGGSDAPTGGKLIDAISAGYGDYETWKSDFVKVGAMRGVGWAVAYQDPSSGRISNHWITLHEDGNPAGYKPILVMDVWEHAFLLDYKPVERPKYIEAFFSNIDWAAVEGRLL